MLIEQISRDQKKNEGDINSNGQRAERMMVYSQ